MPEWKLALIAALTGVTQSLHAVAIAMTPENQPMLSPIVNKLIDTMGDILSTLQTNGPSGKEPAPAPAKPR